MKPRLAVIICFSAIVVYLSVTGEIVRAFLRGLGVLQ